MRALGVSRTSLVPGGVLAGPWVRDPLWRNARAVPTLDLRFADNKSLTDAVTGASLVTFTRASSGTFVDSAGVIQTAAVDVPRFDHNPVTGESLGLLVEEQRTNLALHNRDLTNAAWVVSNITAAKNQVGADGGSNSASSITASAGNGTILQTITSASAARATSAYVKRITGTGTIEMTQNNGTTWTAVTVTSAWTRVTIPSATVTNPVVGFRIVTSGDAIAVDYVQCESGAFSTSAIETTTATVTRSADVASITGSAFSSWYNSTAGTMRVQWIGAVNGCRSFHCEDAGKTSTERFAQRIAGNLLQTEVTSNGVNTTRAASGAGTVTYPATITACSAYNVTDCVIAFRGDVSSTATANGGPECEEIFIGSYRGTANFANGPIARLTYWPQLLPSSTLGVLAP